jgi:hypothetical protein
MQPFYASRSSMFTIKRREIMWHSSFLSVRYLGTNQIYRLHCELPHLKFVAIRRTILKIKKKELAYLSLDLISQTFPRECPFKLKRFQTCQLFRTSMLPCAFLPILEVIQQLYDLKTESADLICLCPKWVCILMKVFCFVLSVGYPATAANGGGGLYLKTESADLTCLCPKWVCIW